MRDDFIRLEDGNVTVYPRALSKRTIWYARYKIKKPELANGQPYTVESLATSDQDIAVEKARSRYATIKVHEDMDLPITGKTVARAITDFLREYEERLNDGWEDYSIYMYRNYKKSVGRYWLDYIGNRKLVEVAEVHFRNYEKWRKKYWKDKKKTNANIREKPKKRTIQLEVNLMKSVLKWAIENKYYSGPVINFVYRIKKRDSRSAFSLSQYRRLVQYLRTNEWLTVGKHGNDKRIIRHRKMLSDYVLILANTGLRVGEARALKWKHIQFDQTKGGKKFVRIEVPNSKTDDSRECIGRTTAARRLQKMRGWRDDNLRPDDFVFCHPNGKPVQDFREGFKALLSLASSYVPKSGNREPLDIMHDSKANEMVPYCLRHTYITFQIRYHSKVDAYAIAQNCGTSVQMIEAYYSDARSEDFIEKLI